MSNLISLHHEKSKSVREQSAYLFNERHAFSAKGNVCIRIDVCFINKYLISITLQRSMD